MRARNRKTPLIGLEEGLWQEDEEIGVAYGPLIEITENTFMENRLAGLIERVRKVGIFHERRNTATIRSDSR